MIINGFINVNKEEGITSNQVLSKIKKIFYPRFGKIKIGHTGTLDPLACGVLPIALGEATKAVTYQMKTCKTYEFTIKFGIQTSTDDREGDIVKTSSFIPTKENILKAIPYFLGKVKQIPPKYSAIKINGKRAYNLARKGEDFEIKERDNYIHALELLKQINLTEYLFKIVVDKGFYVRSFGRDFAIYLNSFGHINYLCRTKSGSFNLRNSITLDKLQKLCDNPLVLDARSLESFGILQNISTGLDGIPVLKLSKIQNDLVRNGSFLRLDDNLKIQLSGSSLDSNLGEYSFFQAFYNSNISGILKYEDGLLRPIRLFNL